MSKLLRDARAFAARVRMSRHRLFLLVEGREIDSPFYERILAASPSLVEQGYVIQLGELVPIRGVTAGGKPHLEALLAFYRSRGLLRQTARDGDRVMAFALDKDFDDLVGRRRRSRHVIYTKYADVEAEVFAHCELEQTLANALSLNGIDARGFANRAGNPLVDLSQLWSEWICLCVRAVALDARCSVHPNAASCINVDTYGPVDPAAQVVADSVVKSGARHSSGRDAQVRSRLARAERDGGFQYLVKGKQIPRYLEHLAAGYFSGRRPIGTRAFASVVTHVALSNVTFEGIWLRNWLDPLEEL